MGESRPSDSPCCDYTHHPLWSTIARSNHPVHSSTITQEQSNKYERERGVAVGGCRSSVAKPEPGTYSTLFRRTSATSYQSQLQSFISHYPLYWSQVCRYPVTALDLLSWNTPLCSWTFYQLVFPCSCPWFRDAVQHPYISTYFCRKRFYYPPCHINTSYVQACTEAMNTCLKYESFYDIPCAKWAEYMSLQSGYWLEFKCVNLLEQH